MELLLDSDRVYEDLEYALRGPSAITRTRESAAISSSTSTTSTATATTTTTEKPDADDEQEHEDIIRLHWRMDLVARAWDPRLLPQSEFRGIVWGGKLTCLCQVGLCVFLLFIGFVLCIINNNNMRRIISSLLFFDCCVVVL